MNILIGLLIILELLVSVMLILVVLLQPSKSGGGLGGALGGGVGEQLFGARTGNVLTKATIVLAAIFLTNTLGLAFLYSRQDPLNFPAPTTGPGLVAPDGEAGTEASEAMDVVPAVDAALPETETPAETEAPVEAPAE